MEFIVKETPLEMSQRKYESYMKYTEIIQWGRRNPVSFCEKVLGIYLLDYQKYIFWNTWYRSHVLWCLSRNAGKSFLGAPYMMTRAMLIPNSQIYIIAGSANQSAETFEKIEKIAKKQIESLTSCTDVFMGELIHTNQGSGFSKDGSENYCRLYNGSEIRALAGNANLLRGKRATLNFYDEAGFFPDELFTATEPFLTQSKDFSLGADIISNDYDYKPISLPNQRIIASSASSVDTHYFELYKDYSKQMLLGNPNYFVADIDCTIPLAPTFNGMDFKPLLTKEVVDAAFRKNPEKALREYYNKFTKDGGDKQAIKRASIIKNSETYLPEYHNVDNKSKYVFAYDPARSYDNSIITVGKLEFDEEVGYKMRIVNCFSLADELKKKHTPLDTVRQVEMLKELILDFNGKLSADYENIECILIDAGAGGGGVNIGDWFLKDWEDKMGRTHRGLIDLERHEEIAYLYPNADDKIKLVEPSKYKTLMYDALVEMIGLGLIIFPNEYNGKDFIFLGDENDTKASKEKNTHMLSDDEKASYTQMDLLKEEAVNMYLYTGSNGSHRYSLPPDKERKMHDDRAYTLALLGYYLQQKRRDTIINPKRNNQNDLDFLAGYANLF